MPGVQFSADSRALNVVEAVTGLDLDGDGDVGEAGPGGRALRRQKSVHWQKLSAGRHLLGLHFCHLEEVRVKRMSELPLVLVRDDGSTGAPVTEVEDLAAAANLRLWEQGDESMYELEAVEKRAANRHHPDVTRVLTNYWWQTAAGHNADGPNTGGVRAGDASGAGASDAETTDYQGSIVRGVLSKGAHREMYLRICRALLEEDEVWSEAEAERLAELAWEEDAKGLGFLTRTAFYNSLFELADMWTPGPHTVHRSQCILCTVQH